MGVTSQFAVGQLMTRSLKLEGCTVGKLKEEEAAGYEASTRFMARDVSQKYRSQILQGS
jgi:hypothetical protein